MYRSDYVDVWLEDVDIPGIGRIDHHVLTMPRASTTAVVTDARDRMLMLWRHRFITDTWGWEVPAGWSEQGESPESAVCREVEEETGWRPGQVREMTSYNALSGISTMRFTAFHATDSEYTGPPADKSESSSIEWIAGSEVAELASRGEIPDGPSLMAVTYFLGIYRPTLR